MPVQEVREGDKPGFRYGESGKVYTYASGDMHARKMARSKASKQGRAIESEKARREEEE